MMNETMHRPAAPFSAQWITNQLNTPVARIAQILTRQGAMSVAELAAECDLSAGLIQISLNTLKGVGAITEAGPCWEGDCAADTHYGPTSRRVAFVSALPATFDAAQFVAAANEAGVDPVKAFTTGIWSGCLVQVEGTQLAKAGWWTWC